MPEPVVIHTYDPRWPTIFEACRIRIARALGPLAQRIEHVGSTAVPHLPAKPIVDLIVVIPRRVELSAVIARLHQLGYEHKGDGGIAGREAFAAPPDAPAQHLYVCAADSIELARQVAFRDLLLAQPATARAYGDLKRSLARRFRHDRTGYTEAKTSCSEPNGVSSRAYDEDPAFHPCRLAAHLTRRRSHSSCSRRRVLRGPQPGSSLMHTLPARTGLACRCARPTS